MPQFSYYLKRISFFVFVFKVYFYLSFIPSWCFSSRGFWFIFTSLICNVFENIVTEFMQLGNIKLPVLSHLTVTIFICSISNITFRGQGSYFLSVPHLPFSNYIINTQSNWSLQNLWLDTWPSFGFGSTI